MGEDPPNAKREPTHSELRWKVLRAPYTWHLRPPFTKEFDAKNWWGESIGEPIAALYELARRHPRVGEARRRVHGADWYKKSCESHLSGPLLEQALRDLEGEPESIRWLCLIGTRSWPTLRKGDKEVWASVAYGLKALDTRRERESCYCINSPDLDSVMWPTEPPKLGLLKVSKPFDSAPELRKSNKRAYSRAEAEITRHAIVAHRQGYLLIAVVPDLVPARALHMFGKVYKENAKGAPPSNKERARWKDWLRLISQFEKLGKQTNQPSIHYRRAIDGIRFG